MVDGQINPAGLTDAMWQRYVEVRELERQWEELIARLRETPGVDGRQVAIAVTDAESAVMRAMRAIGGPQRLLV